MSKPLSKNESITGYPEYAVTREVISRYFSPSLPSSTFYDFVNKGMIVPMKRIRGFYLLNDSLRRLGLREVPRLPDIPSRTTEEIVRLAFHAMEPEVFPAPSWLLGVETIDGKDADHTEQVFAQHSEAVMALATDREKQHYLQGVLDAALIKDADGKSGKEKG